MLQIVGKFRKRFAMFHERQHLKLSPGNEIRHGLCLKIYLKWMFLWVKWDYVVRTWSFENGCCVRAIRASHILISENGNICLTGMRYACPIVEQGKWQRQIHSFPASTARNLNWLSPELLEQNMQGYNEKSDLYSIGVTLCELANGVDPFAGMPTTLMLIEKVRGSTPQLLDSSTLLRDENNELHGKYWFSIETGMLDYRGVYFSCEFWRYGTDRILTQPGKPEIHRGAAPGDGAVFTTRARL